MRVAVPPSVARTGAAAVVACVLAFAQLGLVAWMNHADHPAEPTPRVVPLPILASPKRKPPPSEPAAETQLPQPTLDAKAPRPLAVVEPSAVSGLSQLHAPTDHLPVLPGLSAGDLGALATGNLDTAPSAGQPARPLRRPTPTYPQAAKRLRLEGFVDVRMRVDANGNVVDVVVVNAEPKGVFDEAAIQAARGYRFEPATRGGKAVGDTVEQRMVFRQTR